MRRIVAVALVAVLVVAGAGVSGCKKRKVEVESGTQVICTYGEIISDDIRTLMVPESEVGKHSVKLSTVLCDVHKKVEDLYAQAQEDIAAGDLKGARAKLAEAVALDPKFRNARSQLDAIDAGDPPPPATGGSAPATTTPTPGDVPVTPVGPVVNLTKYVPDTVSGYSAQRVISDVLSLSRVYLPTGGGDVIQLVIQAEQFKDAEQAASKIDTTVKPSYPSAPAVVTVAGKSGYFGTNGRGYAVIALNDGAALVVFEMYSASGKPAALKGALTTVAEAVM